MAKTMFDYLNQSTKNKLAKSDPFSGGKSSERIPIIPASNSSGPARSDKEVKHILTTEQVMDNIKAMEDQGAKREEVQAYLDNLKIRDQEWQAKQAKKTAATEEPEENPGFLQTLVQNIAKPFLKTAATGASAIKGVAGAGKAGIEALQGNQKQARIDLIKASEPVNIDAGYFGKADAIGAKGESDAQLVKEAVGTGAEVASNFVGGGAIKNVAGATIKGQVLRGMGKGISEGAAAGLSGGTGRALQEDKTIGNSVAQGIVDGIVGSVLGGLGGLVGPVAGKVVRKVAGIKNVPDVKLDQAVAKTARKIEGTGINTGIETLPNRMAQRVAESAEKKVALASEPPAMQQAAKAGIDDAWLGMLKNTTKKDREAMVEMVKVAKNSQGKLVKERPVSIAGKSVIDRVNFLKGKRTEVGRAIGNAKKNLPDRQVDITGEADDFAEKLDGMGISISKGGKLNFANSELNNPYSGEDKRLIEFIWDQIKPDENGVAFRTPKQLDLVRGRIKNALSAKPKNIGETTYAETLAGNLRKSLKGRVAETSKAYAKLSNQYAEITRALQDFYGLIQKEWTGKSGEMLNMRAGEVMSRILGNAAAKPQYVLEQLEEVAQKAGRDKLDDPLYQIAFSDLLEDVFGQTQTRSLPGQVERATMSAKEKIDLASGLKNPLATAGKIIDKFSAGQKQKQQALEALLDYLSKNGK